MATIKDVAKRAGVSISTVSRVMNDSKSVNPVLRVRVHQAAEELDYKANSLAQGLKCSSTKRIAVIITEISRVFFTSVLEGIHQEASRAGYTVMIAETHDNLQNEVQAVKYFADQWVDGIILASSAYESDRETKEYVKKLHLLCKNERPIPVVTLEFALDNPAVDAVVIDHEKAAYDAVSSLIHNAKRRRIVHLSLPRTHYLGKERINGYLRAMKDAGLLVTKNSIITGNYSSYSGFVATKKYLESGMEFDGAFCANDQMAVGMMKACMDMGLRIPEDVAIIGNDDIFAASIVSPSLSSISVPKVEMGRTAAQLLMDRIENSVSNRRRKVITLDYRIVERGTTHKENGNYFKHLKW